MSRWAGAYPWFDTHPSHHFPGSASGGVLIRTSLVKDDSTAFAHPHTDGAIPNQPKNDQAAGKGVATYAQFALPFGHIDEAAKQRGGTNLEHYDYHGKNAAVNKLVQDHGYQVYYAGGKYGKPDLANRHYGNKNLMVYDPTPASGGDFNDQDYTDSWRKTHELAHALTYPDINKLYGEGRRIGKLGSHRTTREALRAVHWEHLAAHKQRELNKQLGIEVPDETFNKELNTIMHDAAHRAVTGKFTEPSSEGFVPHSHSVPLETSLGLVRSAARSMGLRDDHDLVKKSEAIFTTGRTNVSEKESTSIRGALHQLHKGLNTIIEDNAIQMRALAKKEEAALAKKSPPGRKKEVEDLKAKGLPASEAFGIAWKQSKKDGAPVKKDDGASGGGGDDMEMAEPNIITEKEWDAQPGAKKVNNISPKKIDQDTSEGAGGKITEGKKLDKGAMPAMGGAGGAGGAAGGAGATAMPKLPKMPKMKAPGMGAAAGGGTGIKPPPMGAGSPQTQKSELEKARTQQVAVAQSGGVGGPSPSPSPSPSPEPVGKAELTKGLGQRDAAGQKQKLPHVRAKVGGTMDAMLAGGNKPLAPGQPLAITPIASNPLTPVGAKPNVGAGGPSPMVPGGGPTMVERVASRVPSSAAFSTPPGVGGGKLPHVERRQAAPSPALQQHLSQLPTTKSEKPLSKTSLSAETCASCKRPEHLGKCSY